MRVVGRYGRWVGLVVLLGMALAIWLFMNQYALHWAAHAGDIERMRQLLDRGADPNALVFRGPTGWRGPTPLIYAIEGRQPDAIRVLAAAGADLERRLPNREPTPSGLPLIWAVEDRGSELTRAMLESGADPNVSWRDDPLIAYAAGIRRCDSVRLLLEYGADVMTTDQRVPLVVESIIGGCPEDLHELLPLMLARGMDVDARLRDGLTVLMVLARGFHVNLIRQLLEAGADPNLVDNQGRTAMDWARTRDDDSRDEIIRLLDDYASNP